MLKKRIIAFLTGAFSVVQCLFAQDSTAVSLKLHMPATGFVINNEYHGNFAKGYTLPGVYSNPRLSFGQDRWLLAVGLHMLKYSGETAVEKATPFFRLQYKPMPSFYVLLGALKRNNAHRLPDMLYHTERRITHHLEEGLQFHWNSEKLWADLWLNWETFIQPADTIQEQFVVGSSNEVVLPANFRLMLKALAAHRGGQITKDTSRVQTLINPLLGVTWQHAFLNDLHLTLAARWVGFGDLSPKPELSYKSGYTVNLGANFAYKHFSYGLDYYRGQHVIAARGNPILQSVSSAMPGQLFPERQILRQQVNFTKAAKPWLHFQAGIGLYHYLNIRELDYRYWFRLMLKPEIVLR